MHQQGLHGIADTGTLYLGVIANLFGHPEIRSRIYIGMADTLIMLDYRYARVSTHLFNQPFASPGDDQVYKFVKPE
jgi:hypothetical protein